METEVMCATLLGPRFRVQTEISREGAFVSFFSEKLVLRK